MRPPLKPSPQQESGAPPEGRPGAHFPSDPLIDPDTGAPYDPSKHQTIPIPMVLREAMSHAKPPQLSAEYFRETGEVPVLDAPHQRPRQNRAEAGAGSKRRRNRALAALLLAALSGAAALVFVVAGSPSPRPAVQSSLTSPVGVAAASTGTRTGVSRAATPSRTGPMQPSAGAEAGTPVARSVEIAPPAASLPPAPPSRNPPAAMGIIRKREAVGGAPPPKPRTPRPALEVAAPSQEPARHAHGSPPMSAGAPQHDSPFGSRLAPPD